MEGQHLVLPFQQNMQLLILHFFRATLKKYFIVCKVSKRQKMFGILIFRSKELHFLFVCLFFNETSDKKSIACVFCTSWFVYILLLVLMKIVATVPKTNFRQGSRAPSTSPFHQLKEEPSMDRKYFFFIQRVLEL